MGVKKEFMHVNYHRDEHKNMVINMKFRIVPSQKARKNM